MNIIPMNMETTEKTGLIVTRNKSENGTRKSMGTNTREWGQNESRMLNKKSRLL